MDDSRTKQYLNWDREHVIHPMAPVGAEPTVVLDEGYGIYVKDTDGKEYIDGSSQLTCVNLGHGQKEITDAVAKQMNKFAYGSLFGGNCTSANIECSRKLSELTQDGMNHFFYTLGGSDSIDTAFRIARTYWRNTAKTGKYKIISLYNSYHGVSFGAVSATGLRQGAFSRDINPLLSGFMRIPTYYCYRCAFGHKYPDCDIQCAKYLAYTIENEGPDTIAAFIAEPIQGTAGVITPPPEYWPMVKKICEDHDVLLIADEVMTGFGRTGKMFGMQNWDVVPDLMTIAKGLTSSYLPLGAVALKDKVAEGLEGAQIYGFTYSGHPVCSAAATKTMEIYIRDKVVENSAEMGKYAMERLNAEFSPLQCIGQISGSGLMIGMEIVTDKVTKEPFPADQKVPMKIAAEARRNGLLVRPGNRMAFTPPLIITREEIDKSLDILLPILSGVKP